MFGRKKSTPKKKVATKKPAAKKKTAAKKAGKNSDAAAIAKRLQAKSSGDDCVFC
jgi:hypothetical protein